MKRTEELNELRGLSADALTEKLRGLENELMNLRFRHASGQLEHAGRMRVLRKTIARAQTVRKVQSTPAA